MPTVYLHIGMNKAGSSAIQSYFHANRTRLQLRGLLWPSTGLGKQNSGAGCHYELSEWLGFGPSVNTASADDAIREMRSQLDAEIASSEADTVVMSSEFFVLNRDMSRVRRFFEGLDLYIVVYLRRHDHWWASLYAQAIKTTVNPPWKRSFNSFYNFQKMVRRQHLEFAPFLKLWADAIGQDRILVCPYEEDQKNPSLVYQFLDAISQSNLGEAVPPADRRLNEKLSSRSLSLIDQVQRSKIEQVKKNLMIAEIINEDEADDPSVSLVPPFMHRQLVDENLKDYEWIARTFLNRPDGQLFNAPLPPELEESSENTTLPPPRPIEFFAKHFTPKQF